MLKNLFFFPHLPPGGRQVGECVCLPIPLLYAHIFFHHVFKHVANSTKPALSGFVELATQFIAWWGIQYKKCLL